MAPFAVALSCRTGVGRRAAESSRLGSVANGQSPPVAPSLSEISNSAGAQTYAPNGPLITR